MKKVLILMCLMILITGCKENVDDLSRDSDKIVLPERTNEGKKYEGYSATPIDGTIMYKSEKYIDNEFDALIFGEVKDKIFDLKYLEGRFIIVKINVEKQECKSYFNEYIDIGFDMKKFENVDNIFEGYKDEYAIYIDCKEEYALLNIKKNID